MLEFSARAVKSVGAALILFVWGDVHAEVRVTPEGHGFFAQQVPSEAQAKEGCWIIEPVAVAFDARDGRLVGGAFHGADRIRENLRHAVFRAVTPRGLDATSALFGGWIKILGRARVTKPDRTPVVIVIEEMLGTKWTVSRSGRATCGSTTLLLRPADAAFLRALAAVRPLK